MTEALSIAASEYVYVFTLRRARKQHTCRVCPRPITPGESYYEVTIAGGGLGSLKFPDRIHMSEKEAFIKKKEVRKTW